MDPDNADSLELGASGGLLRDLGSHRPGDGPEPVPAAEGIRTLEVLDAARSSALENAVIAL